MNAAFLWNLDLHDAAATLSEQIERKIPHHCYISEGETLSPNFLLF
jgi:hypothetical protein